MNQYYNLVAMGEFAEWLHEHRRNKRMLQSEVAKKAGVSTSYISTLERGQKHSVTGTELTPNREKVIAIAKALDADPNEALKKAGWLPIESPEEKPRLIIPPFPKRPKNVTEFLRLLESLGDYTFGIDWGTLDQYTEDDFQELLERIKADVEITVRRKHK